MAAVFVFILSIGISLNLRHTNACVPTDRPGLLLAEHALDDLVYFDLASNVSWRCNIEGLTQPTDVAVDVREGFIFVSDVYHGIIRFSLDGSNMTVIANYSEAPRSWGVTVDTVNRHVYFADQQIDMIRRTDYDGLEKEDIVTELLEAPRGLAVDPNNKLLYWTDQITNELGVSDLDGNSRRVLLASDFSILCGVFLEANGSLYVCDWVENRVDSARPDGSHRRAIGYKEGAGFTDLVVYKDHVYIATENQKLQVMSRCGGVIEDFGNETLIRPQGITLVQPEEEQSRSLHEACPECVIGQHAALLIASTYVNDIFHFDLVTNVSSRCHLAGLKSPTDVAVDPWDMIVFISNTGDDSYQNGFIVRSTLDGRSKVTHRAIAPMPIALTLDPIQRHVYYADVTLEEIVRLSYDLEDRSSIITSGLYYPQAVHVDPYHMRLYWSEVTPLKIEASFLNGSNRTMIVHSDITRPTGLALSNNGRVYFCDVELHRVESMRPDGSDRRVLASVPGSSFSDLAVFQDHVYLANADRVQVVSIDGGTVQDIGDRLPGLSDKIALYVPTNESRPQPSTTTTSSPTTSVSNTRTVDMTDSDVPHDSETSLSNILIICLAVGCVISLVIAGVVSIRYCWIRKKNKSRFKRRTIPRPSIPNQYESHVTAPGNSRDHKADYMGLAGLKATSDESLYHELDEDLMYVDPEEVEREREKLQQKLNVYAELDDPDQEDGSAMKESLEQVDEEEKQKEKERETQEEKEHLYLQLLGD